MENSQTEIPTQIDFFKLKEYFYTNHQAWDNVPNSIKAKNAFMLLRNVAIAYPQVVQALNKIGANQVDALNVLHSILCQSSQPRWSFTSGKAQKAIKEDDMSKILQSIEKFDDNVKYEWCIMNEVDRKLFDDYVKFVPKQLLNELTILQTQMNGTVK